VSPPRTTSIAIGFGYNGVKRLEPGEASRDKGKKNIQKESEP
jgi:hypothetical protein